MTHNTTNNHAWQGSDDLLELIADRALAVQTDELDATERDTLSSALATPGADNELLELELAAAAVALTREESSADAELPAHLRRSIESALLAEADADPAPIAGRIEPKPLDATASSSSSGVIASLGWLAAAAAIAFAAIIYTAGPVTPAADPTLQDQLAALETLDATISADFVPWANDEGNEGFDNQDAIAGRVVWNADTQEGFMIFEGLPPNDPKIAQYQLWIVTADHHRHPVDGGVFNIASGAATGELIVPIDPKLTVENAAAFGVTLEPPGGVVVSDQTRRVVVAPVG